MAESSSLVLLSEGGDMRVALVRNHDHFINSRQLELIRSRAGVLPQLGLAYIHTALKKSGHDVRTIDAQALGLDALALRSTLERFRPQLVGVTATTPGLPGALQAARIAKDAGAMVILGGPHTEVFARENLCHDFVDFVGVGEGATTMPALAAALENREDLAGVPGLVGRTFENERAPMLNLEQIGWPERESVPVERCFSIMAKRPFMTMLSSRGCPFRCGFCFKQRVDSKPLFRDPEDVVGEMQFLIQRWGLREIMFYDDIFTLKKSRVYEICDLIRSRGIKVRWDAPTRADRVDAKLLTAMAKAGCVRLRFGIESGDPVVLERMKKDADLRMTEDAVRAAKRAGIQTFGYFIVGWPGETEEQFQRTLSLAKTIPLDYASFYTATPLPRTDLHDEAVQAGLIPANYWQQFIRGEAVERIPYLVPDADKRTRTAYRQFYYRASRIPTLLAHATMPGMARAVMSGLAGLLKPAASERQCS